MNKMSIGVMKKEKGPFFQKKKNYGVEPAALSFRWANKDQTQ